MDISTLIENFKKQNIQSEKEVCSKLLAPLTELLGYSQDVRSEEFPVYGSSGREKLTAKHADFLLFDDSDFASHRFRNGLDWVYKHSLLVIEAKKPTENIKNIGQPIFYSAWTRAIAYIICNGVEFQAYIINANFSDSLVCSCRVDELAGYWDELNKLNFLTLETLKEEAEGKYSSWLSRNIYDDYINEIAEQCSSELKTAVDRNLQQIDRTLTQREGKDISIQQIVDAEKSIVITSEPGGGKSYFLWMLLREFLHSFHKGSNKIPVLLQGRYYGRRWFSIKEGVYLQIHEILSAVTQEMVDQRVKQGNYVILFDGLDEVEKDYDLLVNDLHRINNDTENVLILTCREQNYRDDFNSGFESCKLLPLTDTQILMYLNQFTGMGASIYYNLPLALRDLLRNPLYLVMLCGIVSENEYFQIPKNMSSLFARYCSDRLKALGCDPFRIDQIDSILRKYAYESYGNSNSDKGFYELLNLKFPGEEAHNVFNSIWKAGLIVKEKEGIRFFHKALQEYFYARELAQKSEAALKEWIIAHANDDNYFEIICYLTGIIADRNKQNYVLDFLEGINLRLYVRALHSRQNFGNIEIDITEEYVHNYFSQLLKTYQHIVETYFSNISFIFDGYLGGRGYVPSLIGTMDPDKKTLFLQIYCGSNAANNLKTQLTTGNKAILSFQDGRSVPINSFVMTQGLIHQRFYNLGMLSYGFDSSREIAFNIIKGQIKKALEGKKFLDMSSISLRSDSDDEYLKNIGAGPDREFPMGKVSCRIDDLYSDQQLVHRIAVIMNTVQDTIDQIHEQYLPVLKTVAPRGRKIGIIYRDGNNSGVQFIKVKVSDSEEIEPILEYSKTWLEMRPEENPCILNKLQELGKSEKDILLAESSAMFIYFEKNVIHDMVYKELTNEFEKIWTVGR